jgi:hypothetical protein
MKLICDDKVQSYFWVDDKDEKKVISPRFDYIEDAINWRRDVEENLRKTWTKTTE